MHFCKQKCIVLVESNITTKIFFAGNRQEIEGLIMSSIDNARVYHCIFIYYVMIYTRMWLEYLIYPTHISHTRTHTHHHSNHRYLHTALKAPQALRTQNEPQPDHSGVYTSCLSRRTSQSTLNLRINNI